MFPLLAKCFIGEQVSHSHTHKHGVGAYHILLVVYDLEAIGAVYFNPFKIILKEYTPSCPCGKVYAIMI